MSVELLKVWDFPWLATLNVLHPQRDGLMRNAKDEDVFDALKKMIEKLPLSVPIAIASFANSTESPALYYSVCERLNCMMMGLVAGGNEFRNYFAKFVLSASILHKSNAQTKIK